MFRLADAFALLGILLGFITAVIWIYTLLTAPTKLTEMAKADLKRHHLLLLVPGIISVVCMTLASALSE